MWYGVLTASIGCSNCSYFVTCEFINKRPYLIFKFQPSRCDDGSAFTPTLTFYMSPTQIRDFMEVFNQESLEASIKTAREKAYTY